MTGLNSNPVITSLVCHELLPILALWKTLKTTDAYDCVRHMSCSLKLEVSMCSWYPMHNWMPTADTIPVANTNAQLAWLVRSQTAT